MRNIFICGLLLLFTGACCQAQTYKFINAKWFDGKEFVEEIWYSKDGFLSKNAPTNVDSIVNLESGFVLPAYGEAHNHNVAANNLSNFRKLSNSYLKAGIYYVQNPNSLLEDRTILTEKNLINNPSSIDATFANGGLTSENGHPTRFFPASSPQGEGNFYHSINSKADLDVKWPRILAGKPDFIKAYLLFCDEYELRAQNPRFAGLRGLSPDILNEVVNRAHAAGLRVGVHVESSADFHVAVNAGADEILHMPGFRGDPGAGTKVPPDFFKKFGIAESDAQLAAKNKTIVITTIGDVKSVPFFLGLRGAANKLQTQNLTLLKREGVAIALGSDAYEKNSLIEVEYLSNLKVFTNAELLRMLCTTTPQTIFPGRKIGKLSESYEASFVVLKRDPLEKIDAIETIVHWIKNGKVLDKQLY